jgi:hypothetical protein
MVKGNWIIFPETGRCKNWVNGIEIVFYSTGKNTLQSKIHYIPPALMEQIPGAMDLALYVFKMWRQATEIFKKVYFKKNQHPRMFHPGYVDSPKTSVQTAVQPAVQPAAQPTVQSAVQAAVRT